MKKASRFHSLSRKVLKIQLYHASGSQFKKPGLLYSTIFEQFIPEFYKKKNISLASACDHSDRLELTPVTSYSSVTGNNYLIDRC